MKHKNLYQPNIDNIPENYYYLTMISKIKVSENIENLKKKKKKAKQLLKNIFLTQYS